MARVPCILRKLHGSHLRAYSPIVAHGIWSWICVFCGKEGIWISSRPPPAKFIRTSAYLATKDQFWDCEKEN